MEVLEILRDMGIGAGRRIQGTATPSHVRAGITFMSAGNPTSPQTGTLTVQATAPQTVTPGIADVVKGAGIYDGAITIAGDADLVAANIKAGVTIFGVTGNAAVSDTTEAANPIAATTVLSGKVGFVNGAKITGTMTNVGAQAITPGTAAQTITAGYHNGSGSVAGDADLVSANIKAGVNIFGVNGKTEVVDTTEASVPIAAATILSGKKGYVNGALVTGTMANKTGSSAAASAVDGTTTAGRIALTPAVGYYDGATAKVYADDANFNAANIVSGVTVFGISGTANPLMDADRQALIAIANAADANNDTIKTNAVTALQARGKAVTTASSWATLVGAMNKDANCLAANIKAGVTIDGVAGTYTPNPATGSQTYNVPGTYNFIVPDGVTRILARIWGAGGGGGCGSSTSGYTTSGAGGGGGGYAFANIPVIPGQTLSVTVGAGGTTAAALQPSGASAPGNPGGASSVGDFVVNGGTGGPSNMASSTGGAPANTADTRILCATQGQGGGTGGGGSSPEYYGGNGGNCWGMTANGYTGSYGTVRDGQVGGGSMGTYPYAGQSPGGGGAGGRGGTVSSTYRYGGKGGDGQVILMW